MRALLHKEAEELRGAAVAALTVMVVASGVATCMRRLLPSLAPEIFASQLGPLAGMAFPSSAGALHDAFRNLLQIGGAALLIVSAGAVAGERDHRTLELLLSRPVTPRQVVWAKALTRVGVALVGVWVAGICSWAIANSLYDRYPFWPVAATTTVVSLTLSFVVSLSIVASVMFRSQVAAILGAAGGCLAFYILSVPKVTHWASPFAYLELGFKVLSADVSWWRFAAHAAALGAFTVAPAFAAGYLFERKTL
jgi:hypothetical protein